MIVLERDHCFTGEKHLPPFRHSGYTARLERSLNPKGSEPKQDQLDEETRARREFLKKIGKGSATVPAAVLLLAALTKPSQAQAGGGCGCGGVSGGCGGS